MIIDKIEDYRPRDGDTIVDGIDTKKVSFKVHRCKKLMRKSMMNKFIVDGGFVDYERENINKKGKAGESLGFNGTNKNRSFEKEVLSVLGIKELGITKGLDLIGILKELKAKGYYLIIR